MNPTEKLNQLSKEAKEKGFDKPPARNNTNETDDADSKNKSSSNDDLTTAQKLMQIVQYIDFFKDRSGTAWAKIDSECYPVRSTAFKRKLQRIYYQRHGKTPYSQALQDVLDQATGIALFDSPVEDVHVRVAKKDRCIIVDRYDGQLSITPEGWQQATANVNFWQPQGLNKLPLPKQGKDGISLLRTYLNFETEDDFRLLTAWLLAAYNPEIPCPILALQGEQGSAKSTNTKVLRALIDPSGAMINPAPREERSLVIQAQNSRVLCLDNLSGLKKWLSDALCRICTGTGFSTRRLYTNDEQQIFQVQRPIILNGIDDIATRGDLLDRSIVLNLPAIPPEKRKDEREFWKDFNRDRPYILDAVYNAISAGLAAGRPQLQALPRMADFAEWITRCEHGLGWNNGSMLTAYNENKDNAIETGLDGDYVGSAIRKILSNQDHYEGTATELCEEIKSVAPDVNEKYLPTTRTLKNKLRRLAPALREVGIQWEYQRKGADGSRTYVLDKVQNKASVPSVPSENGKNTDTSDTSDSSNGTPSKDSFNEKFNSYEDSPF
jgi:hypothetical protein